MRTTPALAAAAAAALLALAACTSSAKPPPAVFTPQATASASAESGGAAIPATSTPANPVPLLKQAGATPDPGQAHGTYDFDGNLYATGTYPGGVQTVTVRTAADKGAYAIMEHKIRPDDQNAVIKVPGRLALIVMTSAYGFRPSAAQVAAKVGGTVDQP